MTELPGVGEVALAATGMYLAGDYLYHHWAPFHDVADEVGHATVKVAIRDLSGHGRHVRGRGMQLTVTAVSPASRQQADVLIDADPGTTVAQVAVELDRLVRGTAGPRAPALFVGGHRVPSYGSRAALRRGRCTGSDSGPRTSAARAPGPSRPISRSPIRGFRR